MKRCTNSTQTQCSRRPPMYIGIGTVLLILIIVVILLLVRR